MCFIAKEKLDEYNKYDKEFKIYESKAKKKNVLFFFTFVLYGFFLQVWVFRYILIYFYTICYLCL